MIADASDPTPLAGKSSVDLTADALADKKAKDAARKRAERAAKKAKREALKDGVAYTDAKGTTHVIARDVATQATAGLLLALVALPARRWPDAGMSEAEAKDIAAAGIRMAESYGWLVNVPPWAGLAMALAPWTARTAVAIWNDPPRRATSDPKQGAGADGDSPAGSTPPPPADSAPASKPAAPDAPPAPDAPDAPPLKTKGLPGGGSFGAPPTGADVKSGDAA